MFITIFVIVSDRPCSVVRRCNIVFVQLRRTNFPSQPDQVSGQKMPFRDRRLLNSHPPRRRLLPEKLRLLRLQRRDLRLPALPLRALPAVLLGLPLAGLPLDDAVRGRG